MTLILDNLASIGGAAAIGLIVGVLTGLFGAGGGFIITPALNIFMGLPMNIAVGTSACQVVAASSFSLKHRLNRKLYGIRIALFMSIGIPLGVICGSAMVKKFKSIGTITVNSHQVEAVNFILLVIFAIFLTLIASWLFLDNFHLRKHQGDCEKGHRGLLASWKIKPLFEFRTIPSGPFSIPVMVVLGFVMGFLSGMLGIGGGVIMMPLLFYLVGQETKYATLTSTMLVFVSGLITSIVYARQGDINYILLIGLVPGAYFGSKLGAILNDKVSGKSIRKYFAFVVLAAVIMVSYKLIQMLA